MQQIFFDSIIMLRFGKVKVLKWEFSGTKKPIKICDVSDDSKVILKLVKTENNSKYLIGYLDEVIFDIA